MGLTYKDSGVNIEGGNSFVKKITPFVKETFSKRVLTGIGGFGALYDGSFKEMEEPVLVSGTDGVGTKLQIALGMEKYDTIGIDAVAMCVNDIITSGARPLFFLDYISCGKLQENMMVDIVKGIADGCKQSNCSLIGGETAEHPSVMKEDDFDIAGFTVGVVDKKNIIDGSKIALGDAIIGLPSSGIHSNGYSLVRKLFFDMKEWSLDKKIAELGMTLGEALLTPTKIYTKEIISLIDDKVELNGLVHITGGGFHENIPRILPDSCSVTIQMDSFEIPPIFQIIQKEGEIDTKEMFTTFNMGIGMIIFVKDEIKDSVVKKLNEMGSKATIIGKVIANKNDKRVSIN